MNRNEIVTFFTKFISPKFPGAMIELDDHFRILDRVLVGQPTRNVEDDGTNPGPVYLVLQKEPKSSIANRVLLFRSQKFTPLEIDFIKNIFNSALSYYREHGEYELYEEIIFNEAVARVIFPENSRVVIEVFNYFELLSNRTYEGKSIAFTIEISNTEIGNQSLKFNELKENDYLMVLTNSINTVLCLDKSANVIEYKKLENKNTSGFYPIIFAETASESVGNKIVISLIFNGDILIFRNGSVLFAKRRGSWLVFLHDQIIAKMACGKPGNWRTEIRKAIYETAIDVSFMHTGGLICISLSTKNNHFKNKTYGKYLFASPEDQKCSKSKFFSALITKKFHKLDRYLRKEICSIDGAILLKSNGEIAAIGAIIKNPSESDEGARTAAAMSLSTIGLAVKISTDGMIKGYYRSSRTNSPIFSIG